MRVSKTVREYIAGQVSQRLAIKYKPQIEQDQAIEDALTDLRNRVAAAMAELGEKMIAEAAADNPHIARMDADLYKAVQYNMCNVIRRQRPSRTVYQQMSDEKEKTIRDIIVELELGGTKADLERLLAKIAVEG